MIKGELARKFEFTDTKICEDYFYKCCMLKEIDYAHCLNQSLTLYRIRKDSMQSNKIRNLYWIWKINKDNCIVIVLRAHLRVGTTIKSPCNRNLFVRVCIIRMHRWFFF